MIWIWKCDSKWVAEDSGSFFKANAMLAKV